MTLKEIPKPNFIIIGSAKCGTTTLSEVLASHPNCCFSRPKETYFFSKDEYFHQGWKFYSKAFSHYSGEKMIGEATPRYSTIPTSPNCAERIYNFNPSALIIYIVRNPYEKLISTWRMLHSSGQEAAQRDFEYFIRYMQKKEKILDFCKFNYQVKSYEKLFPLDQIKIIFLEDWIAKPEEQASMLCDFLTLDYASLPHFNVKGANRSDQRFQERSYFRYLRNSKILSPVRQLIPSFISYRFGRKIGRKSITPPNPNISLAYKEEILDYLREDAHKFLINNHKPQDFWGF